MENIIDILDYSFGYIDFMVTYNNMIENGELKCINPKDREEFISRKNKIKNRLRKHWIEQNPNSVVRHAKELKLIDEYNIMQDDESKCLIDKLSKQLIFIDKLNKLR